jgi:hypothetical protein
VDKGDKLIDVPIVIVVHLQFDLSLWSALKLRIAGSALEPLLADVRRTLQEKIGDRLREEN